MLHENIKTVQDLQILNVKYSSNIYAVESKSFDFKQYFYIKFKSMLSKAPHEGKAMM